MMDIDQVFRDAASDDGGEAAQRIAREVIARLGRRRRRARLLRGAAVAAAALAGVLGVITTLDRRPPPAVTSGTRVEAPEAKPAPTARKGWVQARKRPVKAPVATPAARDPLDDLSERVRREAKRGDLGRLRLLAGEVARSGVDGAWPLLAPVIEALGFDPAAIAAAGEVGDRRAVPYLTHALRLADGRAALAADALRRIPGKDSLAALLEAHERLQGPEGVFLPGIREKVALAIREREDEILAGLLDAKPAETPRILRTLADLRTPAALAAMVEALERPALRSAAREILVRVAGRDLGAEPARWQRWLATEAFGPAGPDADTRRLDPKSEKPIAAAGKRTLPWRWNA